MINGPSVYDSGGSATTRPSPSVYEIDNKKDIYRCWPIKKGFKIKPSGGGATRIIYRGTINIIFNSVRKSNFCTEILMKMRPLAIARTSLIYALIRIY